MFPPVPQLDKISSENWTGKLKVPQQRSVSQQPNLFQREIHDSPTPKNVRSQEFQQGYNILLFLDIRYQSFHVVLIFDQILVGTGT